MERDAMIKRRYLAANADDKVFVDASGLISTKPASGGHGTTGNAAAYYHRQHRRTGKETACLARVREPISRIRKIRHIAKPDLEKTTTSP
jgi:hypothetical protein